RALNIRHLDGARDRLCVERCAARHGDRVIHRHVIASAVAVESIPFVLGADVDAPAALVDDDLHTTELAAIAARPLHRVDRHLIARPARDGDVARDVADRDAAVAPDRHLAREALRLLGAAIASLIGARGPDARAALDDLPHAFADDDLRIGI